MNTFRHARGDMPRFSAIEGFRAWLAWIVVVGHAAQLTGKLPFAQQYWPFFYKAADTCVLLFVIMSGFVITHLIMERNESYLPYLIRRFFRLYPVYLLALALGIVGTYLSFDTFLTHPWGDLSPDTTRMAAQQADLEGGHFIHHLVAHLTMLHGAISSNVLYESQYMFLSPAWSLSLEWQFYLVAPLVIHALRSHFWGALVVVVAVLSYGMYNRGQLGSFILPSFLPGAVLYFAVGIITRLAIKRIMPIEVFPVAALVLLAGVARGIAWLPVVIWFAFVAAMLLKEPGADRLSSMAHRLTGKLFSSATSMYLGKISYPTYILHVPLLQFFAWLAISQFKMQPVPALLFVLVTALPTVLVLSIIVHRHIELPGMALGRRWADRIMQRGNQ